MGIKAGERINPETIQQITPNFYKANRPDFIGQYNSPYWYDKALHRFPFAVSKKLSTTNATIYCIAWKGSVSANILTLADFVIRDSGSTVSSTKTQYTFLQGNDYYEIIKIVFAIPTITDDSYYSLQVSDNLYARQYGVEIYIDFEENDVDISTNQVFSALSEIDTFKNISIFLNNNNLRHVKWFSDLSNIYNIEGFIYYQYYIIGALVGSLKSYASYDDVEITNRIFGEEGVLFKYSTGDFQFIDDSFVKIDKSYLWNINFFYQPEVFYYRTKTGSTYSDWIPFRVKFILKEFEVDGSGVAIPIDNFDNHSWLHQEYINRLIEWNNWFGKRWQNVSPTPNRPFYSLPSGLSGERIFNFIGRAFLG